MVFTRVKKVVISLTDNSQKGRYRTGLHQSQKGRYRSGFLESKCRHESGLHQKQKGMHWSSLNTNKNPNIYLYSTQVKKLDQFDLYLNKKGRYRFGLHLNEKWYTYVWFTHRHRFGSTLERYLYVQFCTRIKKVDMGLAYIEIRKVGIGLQFSCTTIRSSLLNNLTSYYV